MYGTQITLSTSHTLRSRVTWWWRPGDCGSVPEVVAEISSGAATRARQRLQVESKMVLFRAFEESRWQDTVLHECKKCDVTKGV